MMRMSYSLVVPAVLSILLGTVTARATPATGDYFGSAMAAGDFNRDDCMDVAVGMPGATVNGYYGAGKVLIYLASKSGSECHAPDSSTTPTVYTQADFGGTPGANKKFGQALATGDFDNSDPYLPLLPDDLAVGVPGNDSGATDAGKVYVAFSVTASSGNLDGLDQANAVEIMLGAQLDGTGPTLPGTPGTNDQLGFSLATGKFGGCNACDSLAIGAPLKTVNGKAGSGAVLVVYSDGNGFADDDADLFTYDGSTYAQMGSALAGGSLRSTANDTYEDLAIGLPGQTVGGFTGAGAVITILGASSGLDVTSSAFWSQEGLAGAEEQGDAFGQTLAIKPDRALIVGAPYEDYFEVDAGSVNVIFVGTNGPITSGNYVRTLEQLSGGSSGANDHFGSALAVGDFDECDLAIGAAGKTFSGETAAGRVFLIDLDDNAGSPYFNVKLDQDYSDGLDSVDGVAEDYDAFGSTLLAGVFDTDNGYATKSDLFVGVIGENTNAGFINTLLDYHNNGITAVGSFLSQP